MQLMDIGVNLTSSQFDKDRAEVVSEAKNVGVEVIVLTGTSEAESLAAFELTQTLQPQHAHLYSTAGVHPHDAKDVSDCFIDALEQLCRHEHVIAVGECGLDFNRDFSPRPIQEVVFEAQVKLAIKLNLPLFVHQRDAHERLVEILQPYQDQLPAVVIHCFTGSEAELKQYIELGFYIGITGWICDERRGLGVRELTRLIPADKLLIETDAPYLLPRDLKPKPKSRRNHPKYLQHIVQCIADTRGETVDALASQIWQNSCRFFQLDI